MVERRLVFWKLVEERVVAKKLVEVAWDEVEFTAVKFWRVEEALARKPPVRVVRPVTPTVPVKLAEEEMVWPLTRPEVMAPVVRVVE